MPDTIDSLQIEIQSNAASADQSISKLANQLYKLKGSLSGMNTGGLRSLATSLQGFGVAMQSISSYKMPDFNRVASGITKLSSVDPATISTAAGAMHQLGNALASIGNVSNGSAQIAELASALSKMGYKSATTAITNIPLLATAFKDLMTSLSSAPKVSQNVIDLANAMANLSANGVKVSTSTTSATKSLNLFSSAAGKTAKRTKSLAAVFGKLYATYFLLFRGFHKIAEAIDISSSLTEVQNVVSTTFGNMEYKMEDFAQTSIEQFGLSELAAKQYASRFQAMGAAMGISSSLITNATGNLSKLRGSYGELSDSLSDVSLNLTRLTADMASFYNVEQDVVAEDLAAIFTGQTRPLRQYGLDLTNATLKEWALKHGIDANIESMSQAEKTMLRYQYVMQNTAHVQGDFAKTSQTWANQIRILKQNFQRLASVIGNGFIAALRPLVVRVNQAMGAILKAVQSVINALGKIFGWQMIIDTSGGNIADDAEDIADGYDDATDSAKKFKNFLLGIDELNVMPDQDDGGGGSDSGFGGGGGFDANIIPGGIDFKPFESSIDNLFELGKKIGDTLIKMMKDIDWDHIYDQAKNFGKGLADFLNGLISPELFSELGKTIASAINAAIYAKLEFAKNFDWTNFGESIAAGINSFFETFDFVAAAEDINTWANGILDALIAALDHVDWEMIGDQIGTFLSEIDFLTIFKKVAEVIWKALSGALKLTDSMFDAAPVETIILGLVGFSKLLKVKGVQTFTKAIGGLIKKLSTLSLVTKNKGFLTGLTVTFEGLKAPIDRALASLETFHVSMTGGEGYVKSFNAGLAKLTENLSPLAKGLIGAGGAVVEFGLISDAVHDIAAGTEHLGANIAELVGGLIAGAGALTLVLGFPAGIIAAGVIGITGAVAGLAKAWDESMADMQNANIASLFENEDGVPLSEVVDAYADSISKFGDGFDSITEKSKGLEEAKQKVTDVWTEIDQIKTSMDSGVISVEEGTERLKIAFETLREAAEDSIGASSDVIMAAIGDGGTYATALNDMGTSTTDAIALITGVDEEATSRINDLINLMSDPNISTEQYAQYKAELVSLTTGIDDTTGAISKLADKINESGIDYSAIVPDGEYDSSAFTRMMTDVANAVSDAKTSVEESSDAIQTAFDEKISTAISLGNTQAATDLEALAGNFSIAKDNIITNINTMGTEVPNALQSEVLDKLKERMEVSAQEYEDMGLLDKFMLRLKGIHNADEYVASQSTEYKTKVIDPLSEDIQGLYENMGIESTPFASSAAQDIIDAVFDTEYIHNEYSGTRAQKSLVEGWQGIFDSVLSEVKDYKPTGYESLMDGTLEAMAESATNNSSTVTDAVKGVVEDSVDEATNSEDIKSKSKDGGKNIDAGMGEGVAENASLVTDAVKGVANDAVTAAKDELKIQSPSRVFWDIGKYQDEGQANGITDNEGLVLSAVETLARNLVSSFDTLPSQMYSIGANVGNQFASGISSAAASVREAIRGITDSINDAIKAIDDLNKAADNGKRKNGKLVPAFASGGFPEDGIFMANHGELVGSFSNGKTAVANNEQIIEGIKAGVYEAVASAMSASGGNVNVVLEGDASKFFTAMVNENNREIMRTGKSRMRT